jgi:hypothetical protein
LLWLVRLIEDRARLVELVVEVGFFDKRQKQHCPAKHLARLLIEDWVFVASVSLRFRGNDSGRRQQAVDVGVTVGRERDLFQVVGALHSSGRFASLLNGGQQEGNEDADDGDHDEQLD